MRSIEKAVEQGMKLVSKRERLDLRASEAEQMVRCVKSEKDLYQLVQDAFLAGLAIGYRNGGK